MRDSWDSCKPEVGSNGQKFERWKAKLLYLYHILSFDRLASLLKVEALSLNSGFSSYAITVPGGFWSLWLKFLSTDVAQDKSWVPDNPLGVLEGGGYRICCFPALLTYIFSPSPLLPDQTWPPHACTPQTELVPIPVLPVLILTSLLHTGPVSSWSPAQDAAQGGSHIFSCFQEQCDEGHLVTAGIWMRSEADYKRKD